MTLRVHFILLASVLFGYHCQVKAKSCWVYSEKFDNDVTSAKTAKIDSVGASRSKLEEFCREFCLQNEVCQAVLLDLRNWYCLLYENKDHARVRGHEQVALATWTCLKVQNGRWNF